MRFDSYHPAINLIYFVAAIGCTVLFDHPVFLAISYIAAFTYSVKLNGWKSFALNLAMIPFIAAYAGYYSYYNHFGVTCLKSNFIGNQLTLEAIIYGLVKGIMISIIIMWMSCVFTLITTDKIIYLFGKISPKLSLFLSILLRAFPRIKERGCRIHLSREGIGKGIGQGNIICKLLNIITLVSIVITWTLEDFVESSVSMKSRGYSLKGRTAFSIYRFDNRDRSLVLAFFFCLTGIWMAILFNQTTIIYDPAIMMNRITVGSYVFYAIYAIFLFLPMILQIYGEWKFESCKEKIELNVAT